MKKNRTIGLTAAVFVFAMAGQALALEYIPEGGIIGEGAFEDVSSSSEFPVTDYGMDGALPGDAVFPDAGFSEDVIFQEEITTPEMTVDGGTAQLPAGQDLAAALAPVVRYPLTYFYGAGEIPTEKGRLNFQEDGLIYVEENGKYYFCYADGTTDGTLSFESYRKISDTVFLLTDTREGRSEQALVSADGRILVEFGPHVAEKKNDRYVLFTVAEEETDNAEEAMVVIVAEGEAAETELPDEIGAADPDDPLWQELGVGEGEEKGNRYYRGYEILFDLISGQFVETSRITSPKDSYLVAENGFAIVDGESKMVSVYDGNGFGIAESAPITAAENGKYTAAGMNGGLTVYDENLQVIADNASADAYLGEGYLDIADPSGLHGVADLNGNILLTPSYTEPVICLNEELFCVSGTTIDRALFGLVSANGLVLSDCIYEEIDYVGRKETGIVCGIRTLDDVPVYDLYDADGCIVSGLTVAPDAGFRIMDQVDGEFVYLQADTRSFTIRSVVEGEGMGFGNVRFENPLDHTFEAISLLNGQQLFASGFEELHYVYGRYYAYTAGKYLIYQGSEE